MTGGDHLNGTTSNGSTTPLAIIHNTIFNAHGQTDAISLFEDFGTEANREISDNLVAGGGYTIYGGQNPGGPRRPQHPHHQPVRHDLLPEGRLLGARSGVRPQRAGEPVVRVVSGLHRAAGQRLTAQRGPHRVTVTGDQFGRR